MLKQNENAKFSVVKHSELDYRILGRDQGIKYVREKGRVVENSDGLVMDGVLIGCEPHQKP